jgi:hypothetical protein
MSIPDLTKIDEEAAIIAAQPMATIFLHGIIKRPFSGVGHYIECEWCGVKFDLPRGVPEGWLAIGEGPAARYCCHLCAALEFPDE